MDRTIKSKIALIKVWQDWGLAGCGGKSVPIGKEFIKPAELSRILRANGLRMKGLSPHKNPAALLKTMLKIRAGKLKGKETASAFGLHETELSVSNMGIAMKTKAAESQ